MDADRIKGSAKQIKGKIREAAGKHWATPSFSRKAPPTKSKASCKTPSAA